ncbi:uro-adherence factor A-like isoform X2 [Macrobrachium rosenbergii]
MDGQYPHLTQRLHESLWRKLSPRGLEHRVHVPTAITFHRLVPTASRTPRSHHKLGPRSYKYLDPEEIARAQAMARLALLRARLSKDEEAEPIPSVPPKTGEGGSQEKPKPLGKGNKGFKSQKSPKGAVKSGETRDKTKPSKETQTQSQQSSRPKLPVYRGIGETNLRLRQISRLLSMIVDCLQDLENDPKLSNKRKDFVSPHEIEIKNKRWNEFLHSSGRMLFTLKREVTSMERALKQEERNPKFLRMVASSSRSLYKLLQALKTYSETAFQSPSWKKLHSDLAGMCHRLFAITLAIGIQPPKKIKALPKMDESGTEDSSIDSSELPSSEVDTCNIDILQPEYVREKLLAIANKNLQKKRKKKENYTRKNEEIILSPLKYSGKSKHSNHPVEGKIQRTQTGPMKSPTHSHKVKFSGDLEEYSGRGDEPNSSALGSPCKADSVHTPHQTEKSSTHVRKQMNSEGTGINTNEPKTSVCKLQDHNVLVEETANAVVNRLMPLLGQEHEERLKKEPAAGKAPTGVLPAESMPVKDISRQIQYMLERVCKIEEEQKQNINVIGEVSRRLEQRVVFPENTLQAAINQAQNVMNNLTRREENTKIFDSHLRFPTTSITIGSPYGNIMKSDHEARPEKLLKTTSDGSSYVSQDNSLKDNFVLNEEEHHVPESGTITDQIKLQKEEFWASLVEQGFVKPPELAVDGVTAANKVVELMMEQNVPRNAASKENGVEGTSYVSKDTAALKMTHHSTNVKRDAALAKVKREDKATLVTSLMSSYSNSFEAESSEQTQRSSKLYDEGVSKKSFSNSNVSTSVTEPDSENSENSRSGSYPSYDSESVSAEEK